MSGRIELEGKRFGKLTVKEYLGNRKYRCQCDCGNECIVFSSNLTRNHTTSCGCARMTSDLSGKTFGYLRVIERSAGKKRGKIKRVQWKCECKRCGQIVDVYSDCLISGQTISCGCLSFDKDLPDKLKAEFVDGTQLSKMRPTPTKSNKSGVVGVNWDKSRGKWQASIRFKGHKYNLGRFEDFDLACKIRKEAEEALFGNFLKWYNEQQSKE